MSELEHSPLPWTAYEREDPWWEIDHACDGGLKCRLSKEDAEFIVRAAQAQGGGEDWWEEEVGGPASQRPTAGR